MSVHTLFYDYDLINHNSHAMKRALVLICLSLLPCWNSYAQETSDIEKLLEENGILDSEENYEEMLTTLFYLRQHPLDINTVGFDSLKMLFFLSDSQIDQILIFRNKIGAFKHPNELLLITGIGKRDLTNILPFIRIGTSATTPAFKKKTRVKQELLARLKTTYPTQTGYRKYTREAFLKEKDLKKTQEKQFRGPPFGTLLKYKIGNRSRWAGGLTLENDPGESYFTRYQKSGFDFLSAHLMLTNKHWLQKIIIGDYKLQWGQGLVAWHGFSVGKSGASLNNEKSGNGIAPYTSTDENHFLRGIGIYMTPHKNIKTILFVSYKKTDGNIINRDSLDPEELETASLYQSGYHRNLSECKKKHTLKEFTTGGSFNLNHQRFRIGIHALYYDFTPQLSVGNRTYQRYNDTGNKRFLSSLDYKTGFRSFYLFGEFALSDKGAIGTIHGLRYSGFSKASACIIYRHYDKNYRSHYNQGFAEYSNTSNEEGIYIGIESSPVKNLKINLYYDWFRFFAPRYQATIPGSGQEIVCDLTYYYRKWECYFRVKHESKPENPVRQTLARVQRQRNELRFQFSNKSLSFLEFRSRLDYIHYQKDTRKEEGVLIYQDFIFSIRKQNVKTQFRIAYFSTDGYYSRIYAYEHNVLYGYSFPAYQDKGIRSYLNLNWKALRSITFYLKAGMVYYPAKEYLSSSLTRVNDNKLFDLSFQIRVTID